MISANTVSFTSGKEPWSRKLRSIPKALEGDIIFTPCVYVCVSLSHVQLFAAPWLWATRFLCPWDFQGKSTGMGSHSFPQKTFPTQKWKVGLLHCKEILYCMSSKLLESKKKVPALLMEKPFLSSKAVCCTNIFAKIVWNKICDASAHKMCWNVRPTWRINCLPTD